MRARQDELAAGQILLQKRHEKTAPINAVCFFRCEAMLGATRSRICRFSRYWRRRRRALIVLPKRLAAGCSAPTHSPASFARPPARG